MSIEKRLSNDRTPEAWYVYSDCWAKDLDIHLRHWCVFAFILLIIFA